MGRVAGSAAEHMRATIMNIIRNLICVLAGFAISTLAMPAIAASSPPQKLFSLTMAIAGVDNTQHKTPIAATIRNESPPSTASSNIDSFTLTLQPASGVTIFAVNQPASGRATLAPDGLSVTVTNMSPVKGQKSFVLTLYVSGCGDGSTWSATPWTGSNLSGNTFTLVSEHSSLGTNVPCGALACNQSLLVSPSATTGDVTQVAGMRGMYNKDGTTTNTGCTLVDYFVSDSTAGDDVVQHFRWDRSQTLPAGVGDGQLTAAFIYTVNGLLTQVAWLTDTSGNPVFIVPPVCPDATLPAPYATLVSDKGGKTIKVDTSTPANTVPLPATPFSIEIGTERLLVTATNGQNWSVERGQGGTTPSAHSVNALVMSTPLPLLDPNGTFPPPYVAGNQAQMCVQSMSASTTTVVDIGDGWVTFR